MIPDTLSRTYTCGVHLVAQIHETLIATVLIWWFWNAFNWMCLRPKRIERHLKEQGIQGNSYCPLVGDIRDMIKMIKEAKSKPMAPHSNEKNQDRNEARKLTVERGTTLLRQQKRGSPTPKAWPRGLFLRNPNPPQRALSLLLSLIAKHELAIVEVEMD